MACALLQICQGLHDKYLIKPLGENVNSRGFKSFKILYLSITGPNYNRERESSLGTMMDVELDI